LVGAGFGASDWASFSLTALSSANACLLLPSSRSTCWKSANQSGESGGLEITALNKQSHTEPANVGCYAVANRSHFSRRQQQHSIEQLMEELRLPGDCHHNAD
jgi:hypothetical protein